MITVLIIYCVISAILLACIVIPDKSIGNNTREKIVLDVFCILISPIIVAIATGEYIAEQTIYRKKTKAEELKYYETFSKSTQKRLANCMKRYFEYFGRT